MRLGHLLLFLFWISVDAGVSPPLGWNSWDSYNLVLNESRYRLVANYLAKNLKPFGYEYAIIDEGWYLNLGSNTIYTDGYSRMVPDIARWPSSKGGLGLKPIADYVHSLGLKFGFHILRGIPAISVKNNEKIFGTQYTAKDIGVQSDACPWQPLYWGVNMSHPASQLYYDSLFSQFNQWGVDFIKMDCVFAENLHEQDIIAVSKSIQKTGREIIFSLSPGASATPQQAVQVHNYVDIYRITTDTWDCWDNNHCNWGWTSKVKDHLAAFPQFQSQIGLDGLHGKSFPDGDMLPIGRLSDPNTEVSSYRNTSLTQDEQYTLLTLWCIYRSPLIIGADLAFGLDDFTLSLLTNPEVLQVNQLSSSNEQLWIKGNFYAIKALDPVSQGFYVALVNAGDNAGSIVLDFQDLSLSGNCSVRDLWARKDLGVFPASFSTRINAHGSALLLIIQQ